MIPGIPERRVCGLRCEECGEPGAVAIHDVRMIGGHQVEIIGTHLLCRKHMQVGRVEYQGEEKQSTGSLRAWEQFISSSR